MIASPLGPQFRLVSFRFTVFESYLLATLVASLFFGTYAGIIHAVTLAGGWYFSF